MTLWRCDNCQVFNSDDNFICPTCGRTGTPMVDEIQTANAELLKRLACEHCGGRTATWAVMVERNGENIITLASNHMSGRDLSDEDEQVIWLAAQHLLSFIGRPAPLNRPEHCIKCHRYHLPPVGGDCVYPDVAALNRPEDPATPPTTEV